MYTSTKYTRSSRLPGGLKPERFSGEGSHPVALEPSRALTSIHGSQLIRSPLAIALFGILWLGLTLLAKAQTPNGVTVAGALPSAATHFAGPHDVYVDGQGNIYVADQYNHRIQKWAPGAPEGITVAGGNGAGGGANQLAYPKGVHVDGQGNIYVADSENDRIQKFPSNSTSVTSGSTVAGGNGAGAGANQFNDPYGVFVDGAGNIYVSDWRNYRIQKWAPGATQGITVAGGNGFGSGANQLWHTEGVFVDGAGNLYVADSDNDRIQMFPPNSTSATAGITVAGGNGGGSGANQFDDITDVFVDGQGNIYVADTDNHRIQKWAPGAPEGITVAGGNVYGSMATQLSYPEGVFVDGEGNIYVADSDNARIQKFPPNSTSATSGSTVAGTLPLYDIWSLALDGQGNVYVANWYYDRIQKFAPGSRVGSTVAGGNGKGSGASQLDYPYGVYVDGGSTIYVADAENSRIQKWAPGATQGITVAGGNGYGSGANQLKDPTGMYVDGGGNVYIADYTNNRVQKFPPNSTSATSGSTVAGGNGRGSRANQLASPSSVYVDGAGNLYVSDYDNHRVQKFPPNSTSATSGSTVAGGNGYGGGANQLANPYGMYVDGGGTIYVADEGNHRIQKFPPNSTSATAGITVAGGNGEGTGANQLSNPLGVAVDGAGYVYVADTDNYRIQKFPPLPATLTGLSVTPSSVCAGQSLTFTATVGNVTGSYSYRLTNGSSTTLGTSTSSAFTQGLVASGIGPQTFTLTVGETGSQTTATTSLTVNSLPKATLTNDGPLSCTLTTVTLTASGGTSYTFANGSGALLVGSGNTRPVTTSGTYSVSVANSSGCVSTTSTTVTSTTATLTVINPTTTTAIQGTAFSQTFTGSGGVAPFSFSLASGNLPTGLNLGGGGVLSGTPTQSGTFTITIRASDANGCFDLSNTYTLVVNPSVPDGPVCDTYTTRTTTNGLGSNNVFSVYAVGNVIYTSTNNGLSISTDGGSSFTNKTTVNGLGNNFVVSVYALGSVVYAATQVGLSISTDGGNSFTNKTTANGLGNNFVVGVYAVGNVVYAATGGGLSISTDGGSNFTNRTIANGLGSNIVRGVYVLGNLVYAATDGGLSISTDGGSNFTNKTTANGLGNNFLYGVYAVGNVVYAATSGGLSISTDGGNSFTNKTTANGLGSNFVTGVYVLGNVVYAPTDGGLGISIDGGSSFTNKTTANGLGSNTVYGVYALGNRIYAASVGGGLSFCLAPPTLPDLIPLLYVTPSLAYSTTTGSVVVDVFELNSTPTSGTITVHISKSSLLSLSFDPGATSFPGHPVQNGVWSFDATSSTDAYILTTTQVIGARGKLSVGLSSILTPGITKGSVSITATLVGSSGGEVTMTNNTDADQLEYFNK